MNRVSRIAGRSPLVIEGSITDIAKIEKIFVENTDISSVIHFAALKAVGESTKHPLKYYHNNVTGSVILLDAMQRAGVKNLVFSSSCTVYGEPEKVPISEDFPVGSVSSPYGRTKYMMEEIIQDYSSLIPLSVVPYFVTSTQLGPTPAAKLERIRMAFRITWFLLSVRWLLGN